MGHNELIGALRREGEERVRSIRREEAEEEDRLRKEASERIERIREDWKNNQTAAVRERIGAVLSDARRKARMILLAAQEELSDRLYQEAVRSLSGLRAGSYVSVFRELIKELPDHHWQVVRVNPDDEEKAREYFPNAEIICDGGISGGLDVMEKGGTVRIVNTFEKRLENMWEDILPGLIKDVCKEIL